VPLTDLRLLAEGRHWEVDQRIAELTTLTPVRGSLRAHHHGTVLEVDATLATIVTLRCDRCLNHFNQALQAQVRELIELRAGDAPPDPSLPEVDDLDERLDPLGRFDPERWIFEQLNLRLPLVNRCGADCPGPPTWSSEPPPLDPRWAALQGLGSS